MSDQQQVNLAQSVKTLKDNMPAMLELSEMNARLCRAKFVALVDQGFTETQSLELCWRL